MINKSLMELLKEKNIKVNYTDAPDGTPDVFYTLYNNNGKQHVESITIKNNVKGTNLEAAKIAMAIIYELLNWGPKNP